MSQIDTIKAKVSPADAGRHYGLKISRSGMVHCPFHNDTNPSMKLYDDHFYSKRGFKTSREKYAEEHKEELEQFNKSVRYLKANRLSTDDRQKLVAEAKVLKTENQKLQAKMRSVNIDPEMIRQIRYCVDTVLHEAEIPERKESVLAKLKTAQAATQTHRRKQKDLSLPDK